MFKVSGSLIVGNLIFYTSSLSDEPDSLVTHVATHPEEMLARREEGCPLLSHGSLISWTWRSIELALLCL